MNSKGFFLSFMAFLLISSVLTLQATTNQAELRQERREVGESVFDEVNNAFENIYGQMLLSKEGDAGKVQARFLPFDNYSVGENWVEIDRNFPGDGSELSTAYDAFTLFSIFSAAEDTSMDLNIETNVALNSGWGGADDNPLLTYLILPQCVKFTAGFDESHNAIDFIQLLKGSSAEGDGCDFPEVTATELGDVNSFIVTAKVTLADYDTMPNTSNSVDCTGEFRSGSVCKNEPYDPARSEPYGFIHLIFTDCWDDLHKQCEKAFPSGEYFVSNHFDPTEENKLTLSFTGGGETMAIEFSDVYGEEASIYKNGQKDLTDKSVKLDLTTKITFNNSISSVEFNDFNIMVKKDKFDYCRASGEGLC